MNCAHCGHEKTRITKTEKKTHEGDWEIVRLRKCEQCERSFYTYECYERADVEASMELRDIHATIKRVSVWLQPASIHIPVVRDCRRELLQHLPKKKSSTT